MHNDWLSMYFKGTVHVICWSMRDDRSADRSMLSNHNPCEKSRFKILYVCMVIAVSSVLPVKHYIILYSHYAYIYLAFK